MSDERSGGSTTTVVGGRVVTPDGTLDGGVIEVVDGRIVAVSGSVRERNIPITKGNHIDADGAWVLPGFIDLHMHGGGGYDVTRSRADMAGAVAFHRRHGTTRTLVSLMAQPIDALRTQLGWIADLTENGDVLGAHLEGPFLSPAQCGAQRPADLLQPDRAQWQVLLEAGRGCVRTVTIAPELPGALDLIADVASAGVIAAIGHTAATFDQTIAAIDAGATLATHAFNAMGSFQQRRPGAAGAVLDAGIFLEVIGDGVHLHDALVRLLARTAPDRIAFVTDAISAAGAPDGDYTLGDQPVTVTDGQARLTGASSLAGSTTTMADTFRRAVKVVGLSIEAAVAATSTTPAAVLGLADRYGTITVGSRADLVILDDDLRVVRVVFSERPHSSGGP